MLKIIHMKPNLEITHIFTFMIITSAISLSSRFTLVVACRHIQLLHKCNASLCYLFIVAYPQPPPPPKISAKSPGRRNYTTWYGNINPLFGTRVRLDHKSTGGNLHLESYLQTYSLSLLGSIHLCVYAKYMNDMFSSST
jgi:hypothetical protein